MSEENIKIYTSKSEEKKQEKASEMDKLIETLRMHRVNGNLEKAKALGELLGKVQYDYEKLVAPLFIKPDIIYQMKALYVFSAEASLQLYVYDQQLYTTAINAMYDTIQKHEEGFYRNISDGVAHSFYYSEMKKGGDIEQNIGRAFAMLCSAQSSDSFAQTGAQLYKKYAEDVQSEIEKAAFTQI